ncbi:MAG: SpoVR family protein [Alphaproteobacteria bacterium]|nr:SpoVR family protein [Alphaproteobacteria bacterium]
MTLLFDGADWDFQTLDAINRACTEIAVGEYGLDIYPNQIEVITSEQMLDAYCSNGLPLMYSHWSFGKRFARDEALYRRGYQGLAYEIVINASPCISYIMEENTATLQALVISHACFGHNHFFRNNYLFRQWTDAEAILGYLAYAKAYVAECEERQGRAAVERILDAAHAVRPQGIHRYPKRRWRLAEETERAKARAEHAERTYDPLMRTVPGFRTTLERPEARQQMETEARAKLRLPEENLLYFCEKHSPRLAGWERELIRIVRLLAQYFYPQAQTKVANEGCATFCHYHIMTRLHETGQINDGALLEFLHSHSAVILQPDLSDERFSGWNPYALGFAIMRDLERVCLDPDAEDRDWFPAIAGNGDPWGTLRDVWANYRDEGLIRQFLGPKVMRAFRMVHLADRPADPDYRVAEIHDEAGFRRIASLLADQYEPAKLAPLIEVADVDLFGSRTLKLVHESYRGARLDGEQTKKTLQHLQVLWGYRVCLQERDAENGRVLTEYASA